MNAGLITDVILNGFNLSLFYISIALGLTLVYGILNIINFAHGEMYMLGGFMAYLFGVMLGVNWIISALIAGIVVGGVGILIERGLFSPFQENPMGGMITAVAVSSLLQNIVLLAFGARDKAIPEPVTGVTEIFGSSISNERMLVSAITLVLIALMYLFIYRTKFGAEMRAVAQDKNAACLMGASPVRVAILGMAVGCALAGIVGAITAPVYFINPSMGGNLLTKAFVVVILGGLGSLPGAIIGGLILGFVDSTGLTFWGNSSQIIGYVILMLVLLVRPKGILGHE